MRILCFGSLNIDYTYRVDHFVQKGETISSKDLQIFSGGKGFNQSIALAKSGMEVYHAGAIGTDGMFLLEQMKQAGVHAEHVQVLDDVPTGHAMIQNDKDGDNCILLYGGANQAITTDQADHVLSFFHEGDYLLLQNEINITAYLMRKAHTRGMKIALNPSPMNEKIFDLPLELVDCLILNEIEASQLLANQISAQETGAAMAGYLKQKYPSAAIVLTLGEAGSVFLDQEQIFQKIYAVHAVDTTAAGDTFTGYFLGTLLQGGSVPKAMDRAARASAIAVTRPGAAPSIPSLEEVLSQELSCFS